MVAKPVVLNFVEEESPAGPAANAWSILHHFGRKPRPVEQCELCSVPVTREHCHLLEVATRRILCSCGACALQFGTTDDKRFKRVPRKVQMLDSFHMTDAQWDALLIPVNMAFFFFSSLECRVVAFYPSPAGPVESRLSLEAWSDIAQKNPVLRSMKADVEALLVNRLGNREYFIAPMDECYKLVGLIRTQWHGLSGGPEVRREITEFFARLKQKAQMTSEDPHA